MTTALAVSGLPVDRFCFEGFLPRKAGGRRALLAELAGERRTMVFFESPHRLAAALADLAAAFGGDRPAAVCRELTKTYEQVRAGRLAELAEWAAGEQVRGRDHAGGRRRDRSRRPAGRCRELAGRVAAREAGRCRPQGRRSPRWPSRPALPKRVVFDAVVAGKPAPARPRPELGGADH